LVSPVAHRVRYLCVFPLLSRRVIFLLDAARERGNVQTKDLLKAGENALVDLEVPLTEEDEPHEAHAF
jgi:hypothetical protein